VRKRAFFRPKFLVIKVLKCRYLAIAGLLGFNTVNLYAIVYNIVTIEVPRSLLLKL
jgi:hypothetical protein